MLINKDGHAVGDPLVTFYVGNAQILVENWRFAVEVDLSLHHSIPII